MLVWFTGICEDNVFRVRPDLKGLFDFAFTSAIIPRTLNEQRVSLRNEDVVNYLVGGVI